MDDRPIGVFDSGFGGLTVTRALIDLLPYEQIVYAADSGRYPYGPRPADEVRRFAFEIADHLVEIEDVKMIVVACNTASSVALEALRDRYAVPVTGVIAPGLRAAQRVSESGRIGVIGTIGTIASGAYQELAAKLGLDDIACVACPGFVELVEHGDLLSRDVYDLAEQLLSPLREKEIDTLLLGCTHYPFLARAIGDVMGRSVVLVSSAEETAFDVRARLEAETKRSAKSAPSHRFLSSGDLDWFVEIGRRLLGPELVDAEPVLFSSSTRL